MDDHSNDHRTDHRPGLRATLTIHRTIQQWAQNAVDPLIRLNLVVREARKRMQSPQLPMSLPLSHPGPHPETPKVQQCPTKFIEAKVVRDGDVEVAQIHVLAEVATRGTREEMMLAVLKQLSTHL